MVLAYEENIYTTSYLDTTWDEHITEGARRIIAEQTKLQGNIVPAQFDRQKIDHRVRALSSKPQQGLRTARIYERRDLYQLVWDSQRALAHEQLPHTCCTHHLRQVDRER